MNKFTKSQLLAAICKTCIVLTYIFVGTGPFQLHDQFKLRTKGELFTAAELIQYHYIAQEATFAAALIGLASWVLFRYTSWYFFKVLYSTLIPECAFVVRTFGFAMRLLSVQVVISIVLVFTIVYGGIGIEFSQLFKSKTDQLPQVPMYDLKESELS